jgi:hypothetical protein
MAAPPPVPPEVERVLGLVTDVASLAGQNEEQVKEMCRVLSVSGFSKMDNQQRREALVLEVQRRRGAAHVGTHAELRPLGRGRC